MKLLPFAPLLVLLASPAFSADLVIEEPAFVPDAAITSGFYAQVLGGIALPGVQDWTEDGGDFAESWDLDAGYAISAALGVNLVEGLSAEFDVLHSHRAFTDFDDTSSLTSLMGNLKYTVDVSDTVALYGAVGLGYVWEDFSGDDFGGFGYQLIAGAELEVADNISLVGEYRFQNTFAPMENVDDSTWTHQLPTHHVLAGIKFGF